MLLFMLCMALAVSFVGAAQAKQKEFKSVIFSQDQIPHRIIFKVQNMVLARHGMGAVLDSVIFVSMPDNGDTRTFSREALGICWLFANVDACEYKVFLVGCASPRRFHRVVPRMTDLNNASLGFARASALNDSLGIPGEPFPETIRDWRPGVLIVRVFFPATVKELPVTEVREYHDTTTVIQEVEGVAFDRIQPFVGYEHVALEHGGYGAPVVGIEAVFRTRIGTIAAVGYEGRSFNWPDHAVIGGGLQFGDDNGLFGIVEAKSGWRLDNTDHYESRAIGIVVGSGLGLTKNFANSRGDTVFGFRLKLRAGAGLFHLDDDVRSSSVPGVTLGGRICVSF